MIELYSRPFCPFCVRLERLLRDLGLTFDKIDLGREPNRKTEMVERTGGPSTVPQLFINDKYVGDCTEVERLHTIGEFMPIIKGEA